MRRHAAFLFATVSLAGCVPLPQQAPHPAASKAGPDFPKRLAVFPLANQAGDADGAIILRYLVIRELGRELGYYVQAPEDTDRIIHERTLTGPEIPLQVAMARQDPGVMADWEGVDGLLHGELQAYNRAQLTVWVRSQVKARFWLTDRKGKKIWDSSKDSDSSSLGGGSASIASLLSDSGIPAEVMEKIRASPLAEASLGVVEDAFSTFPTRY
jgi:hypothetical protein